MCVVKLPSPRGLQAIGYSLASHSRLQATNVWTPRSTKFFDRPLLSHMHRLHSDTEATRKSPAVSRKANGQINYRHDMTDAKEYRLNTSACRSTNCETLNCHKYCLSNTSIKYIPFNFCAHDVYGHAAIEIGFLLPIFLYPFVQRKVYMGPTMTRASVSST